jgi:hypothetical protein
MCALMRVSRAAVCVRANGSKAAANANANANETQQVGEKVSLCLAKTIYKDNTVEDGKYGKV